MVAETKTERLWLFMSHDRAEEVRKMAHELNLSVSQYLAMSCWMGSKIIRESLDVGKGDEDAANLRPDQ